MLRLIIRHGNTGVKRDDRDKFGVAGPPLDSLGIDQAKRLGKQLSDIGVDLSNEPVAVSELLRTRHTAERAGFTRINTYSTLNEVRTGLPADDVKQMLAERLTPDEAMRRAKMVLENPPEEKIWIIHGLLIVGLHAELGVEHNPFVPDFCEISLLDI